MSSHAVVPRPRPAPDVHSNGADLAALEAAAVAARKAREKGLPNPLRIGVAGDSIDAALLMPDLLLWLDLLEQAEIGVDAAGYLVVHGHTGDGTQKWTLRPVHEACPAQGADGVWRVCRRCEQLPDSYRQPLSPEAWRDQCWFELTGRNWDTPPALGGAR